MIARMLRFPLEWRQTMDLLFAMILGIGIGMVIARAIIGDGE